MTCDQVDRFSSDEGQRETTELSVQVDLPYVTAAQLEQLQVGDVLLTNVDADGLVEVLLDGKAAFQARLGSAGGRRAVELTRPVETGKSGPNRRRIRRAMPDAR